jgi:hypothetical protein
MDLKNLFLLFVADFATMAQGKTARMAPYSMIKNVTKKSPTNSDAQLRQGQQLTARKCT